jgi:hypothetical protein
MNQNFAGSRLPGCSRPTRSGTIISMRRATLPFVLVLAAIGSAQSQTPVSHAPDPDNDRLGMPCAQILKMTSADWVTWYDAKTRREPADLADFQERATGAYGKCYDARTDALAASLTRSGKGPSKAARAEFTAFETDLKNFETKAVGEAKPAQKSDPDFGQQTRDADKFARRYFADLYEKQFRYEFYKEFEEKSVNPARPTPTAAKPTAPAPGVKSSSTSVAPNGKTPAASPSGDASSTPHEPTAEERAHSDADPVTQAKNRFGKILEALPEEQMHEVHSAFSEVIGAHAMSESMRLAVYRYAIYLLQPAGATPPEPAPF